MATKKNLTIIIFLIFLLMFFITLPSLACEFVFNYEKIEAPLGTVGEVGVRVYKTHNNCTLNSMDEYYFETDKLQILEESNWQEVERNVYEKWFNLMLSEKGEGYILIWKECSKEGYQEKRLAVNITATTEEVKEAIEGSFPYESNIEITKVYGNIKLQDDSFVINDVLLTIPEDKLSNNAITVIQDYQKPVYAFYDSKKNNELLLIAGEDIYYRFD